jgi:hypothetical protein
MLYWKKTRVDSQTLNQKIKGSKEEYNFYRTSLTVAKEDLSGNNIICLASCYNINSENIYYDNFTHISFHKNLEDFFETDDKDWIGIHSMFFMPIEGHHNANDIIDDIKSNHQNCIFNKN